MNLCLDMYIQKMRGACALFFFITVSMYGAENNAALSFMQEFQLDFINQEIHRYPDIFLDEWATNSSVQLVIECAELAVQNSSDDTKPIMRQEIMYLFGKIGISIEFTPQDLIIKKIDTDNTITFHPKGEHHVKIKKRKKTLHTTIHVHQDPPKIKGARRTLRRIREKFAQKQKQALEEELERIKTKMSFRNKESSRNLLQRRIDHEPEQEHNPAPTNTLPEFATI